MYKPFDLSPKTVLVTGGNRGIGFGMAQALADAGATVIIWGRSATANAEAAARIQDRGGACFSQSIDVSDPGAVEAGMREALSFSGRLDAAFANAGAGQPLKPFIAQPQEALEQALQMNLGGCWATFQHAARHMVERAKAGDPGGSLVAFSTVGTVKGMAYLHPYAAAKAGIEGLVHALAMELGRYGIRTNAVRPGFIQTDMTERMRSDGSLNASILARIPARRWGTPEDFGGLAVYLASDASAYHSGDTLVVDGGYLRV